jgi:hypothetical protein
MQSILSSYNKKMSPDETAFIAKQCSAWNEEVAFVQACHDYCSVYQPTLRLPQVPTQPPKFPFELRQSDYNKAGQVKGGDIQAVRNHPPLAI